MSNFSLGFESSSVSSLPDLRNPACAFRSGKARRGLWLGAEGSMTCRSFVELFVCVCIYIHVPINVFTHICVFVWICIYTHLHLHAIFLMKLCYFPHEVLKTDCIWKAKGIWTANWFLFYFTSLWEKGKDCCYLKPLRSNLIIKTFP